jgi:hypothetical protein
MAAVIFRIKKVEEALLCESEKIIIEFATMTATIIAEMKYPSVFRSCICFSADSSNHFQISFLMYKHFPHGKNIFLRVLFMKSIFLFMR